MQYLSKLVVSGYKVKKVIVADICLTESYKCNAYGLFYARDRLSV